MYALIQKSDNKILRVSSEGLTLAESKPFYWVECPDETTTAWSYDGDDTFTEPLIEPETPEQIQARINADALAYLASTDWYVVRFAETGVAIPADVLTLRQEARDAIV
jgi:hypothetical protein